MPSLLETRIARLEVALMAQPDPPVIQRSFFARGSDGPVHLATYERQEGVLVLIDGVEIEVQHETWIRPADPEPPPEPIPPPAPRPAPPPAPEPDPLLEAIRVIGYRRKQRSINRP